MHRMMHCIMQWMQWMQGRFGTSRDADNVIASQTFLDANVWDAMWTLHHGIYCQTRKQRETKLSKEEEEKLLLMLRVTFSLTQALQGDTPDIDKWYTDLTVWLKEMGKQNKKGQVPSEVRKKYRMFAARCRNTDEITCLYALSVLVLNLVLLFSMQRLRVSLQFLFPLMCVVAALLVLCLQTVCFEGSASLSTPFNTTELLPVVSNATEVIMGISSADLQTFAARITPVILPALYDANFLAAKGRIHRLNKQIRRRIDSKLAAHFKQIQKMLAQRGHQSHKQTLVEQITIMIGVGVGVGVGVAFAFWLWC
jgi:hypothetical protein